LNSTFNTGFEDNFNTALNMSLNDYDYSSLINFLNSDKIVEKQIAVLKLTEIRSAKDADLLVSNLVGQNGKIREVVSFKINELIKNPDFTELFLSEKNYEIFMQAVKDINGNVCRQIVEVVVFLKNNHDLSSRSGIPARQQEVDCDFSEYFCKILLENIENSWAEIKTLDLRDKKYVLSKYNFQLYWCLEVLFDFVDMIEFKRLKKILLEIGEFYDYTIREKVAKILTKVDNPELSELKEKLKNDENYYVRRYFN